MKPSLPPASKSPPPKPVSLTATDPAELSRLLPAALLPVAQHWASEAA